MDRNLYADIINDLLRWAKETKGRGEFFPCIQSHMMSKIDGILEVAVKDRDLSIQDFKWLSGLAFEKSEEIRHIMCDPTKYY